MAVEEAGSSSSDEEPDDLATAGTRHMPAAQTDEGSREVTLESEPASTSSAVNPTQTPSLGRRVSAEEHPSMDAETSWQTDLPSDEDEDELNWQMEMTDLDTDAEPTATSAAADVAVGSASVSKSSICATEKLTAKSPVPIVIKPTATCDEHPSVQSISDDSDVEELDESNKDEEVDHVPEGQVVYKDGFIMAKLLDKFTKKIRKCDSIIQIKKVIRRIAKWIQRVGRELIGDSLKELSILQKSPRAGVVNSAQLVAHRLITKLKLELIVQETLRQTPERPEGEGSFNEAHAAAVYRLVSDAFNQPGQHKAFLDQLAGQHVVLDNQQCPLPFTHARCVTFLLKMAKKSLQKREAHEKELDVLNEKLSVIKSHLIRVLCHALRIKMCNAAELEFKKKTQMLPRRKLFFVFNKKLCSLTNFKQTISSLKKRQFKIRGLFYPLRPDVDISHLEAQIHEHAQLLASKDNQKQCKQARHDLVNTVLDSLDLQDERHSSEPEGNMSLSTPGGKEMETTCSETELGNVMEKLKKNKSKQLKKNRNKALTVTETKAEITAGEKLKLKKQGNKTKKIAPSVQTRTRKLKGKKLNGSSAAPVGAKSLTLSSDRESEVKTKKKKKKSLLVQEASVLNASPSPKKTPVVSKSQPKVKSRPSSAAASKQKGAATRGKRKATGLDRKTKSKKRKNV